MTTLSFAVAVFSLSLDIYALARFSGDKRISYVSDFSFAKERPQDERLPASATLAGPPESLTMPPVRGGGGLLVQESPGCGLAQSEEEQDVFGHKCRRLGRGAGGFV